MDVIPTRFFLEEAVERFGEQPFMLTSDGMFTYQRIYQNVFETALRLKEAGIKEGERIAILAPNGMAYVILLIAMWKTGVIAVPISTRWTQKQVAENLQIIESSGIFTSKEHTELQLPSDVSHFILEDLVPIRSLSSRGVNSETNRPWMELDATIIFTSGSSGRPKAVLHTLGNHLFSALGSNRNIPVAPGDRWLLSLPLYHVGGMAIIFRVILGGGTVAVPIPDLSMEDNIRELQITHVSLVSTQLFRLLGSCKDLEILKKLKAILVGGSAIPDSLIRNGIEQDLPIFKSYGSSEMASQITTTRLNDSREKLISSGALLEYRQMKIADDNEILLKGRTLFRGYVEGKRIIRVVDEEGWFLSGDLGYMDKDGYLYVTGRKDNMFISGGENIQPEEIEGCLVRIDCVEDAVVVPIRNREFGHRPAAFLKIEPNCNLRHHPMIKESEEMLPYMIKELEDKLLSMTKELEDKLPYMIKQLEEMLPRFKVPDYFFPWPEEGNQGPMKPDRKLLKRIAEDLVQRKIS